MRFESLRSANRGRSRTHELNHHHPDIERERTRLNNDSQGMVNYSWRLGNDLPLTSQIRRNITHKGTGEKKKPGGFQHKIPCPSTDVQTILYVHSDDKSDSEDWLQQVFR